VSWVYLFIGIVFEVAGTTCMKLSEGLTRLLPSVLIFVFYAVSFGFFTLCLRGIEISVAYAIWAGVGVLLISVIGILFFQEPLSGLRIACIALIIAGVAGLRLTSAA
jgi:small multidrug resistance pump